MIKRTVCLSLAALAAAVACKTVAATGQIAQGPGKELSAEFNQAFPGLLSYSYNGGSIKLPAAAAPVVLINGQSCTPQVTFAKTAAGADYLLAFPEQGVTMTARFTIQGNVLSMKIVDVREKGPLTVRTIEIPGLALLAGQGNDEVALGNFPAGSYASEKPEDWDIFATVATLPAENPKAKNHDAQGRRGASYAFVSNGQLAAGLYVNTMEEDFRSIVSTAGEGQAKSLSVAPGKWTYREIPTEIVGAPEVRLVVATDLNGDSKTTWQDAAVAYRQTTPRPYGWEKAPDYPIAHIAMNFGSQATHPFLRVLDNEKKIWLYTDGLGQRVQQKGFAGEGHDSSHPDYAGNVGRRMGGRDELNFVMRRGHDFNVLSGIHINAHEYHKEAKEFNTDIANLEAIGWCWLDESYLTDYRYDSAYGTLYRRLEAMRDDLPWLDFIYLDVYYGRGWPGWRMHTKVNSLGIMQHTEFPGIMERGVVWNHVANDWTQAVWGKGDRSAIARFIYFSQKDTFKHDPLLRGTNCDGFMGWHAERNMMQTVASAFTVNLPTAYLQHAQLLRQEPAQAWFDNGVRTETQDLGKDQGIVARIYGRDGQLVNSCRYPKSPSRPVDNLVFLPWNPNTEEKIYHWNDKGGTSTWNLPKSWAGMGQAQLYRLTDLGRIFEREIPIQNGKVTLDNIAAATPYVLYRETPPALPDMKWGEGGLVRDPGFDSHTFDAWTKADGSEAAIVNDKTGQSELTMVGTAADQVRQEIAGLVPGQTYAASVWVNIEGEREATLAAETNPAIPLFVDKLAWKTLPGSTKTMGGQSARNLVDGNPKNLWHTTDKKPEPAFPHQVGFDFGKTEALDGFVLIARADRGNGTIKGYEAWTSLDKQNWEKVAAGEFTYDADNRAMVKFGKTVPARCFRLVSLSEVNGKPYSSAAELEFLQAGAAAPAALPATMTLATASIHRTFLLNYTDQSDKYMRAWHRMKVLFTAPADGRIALRLQAAAGQPKTVVRFDDVRLVKSGISQAPATAVRPVLFEDFENVDEAWGPFMYGWQGPMNTHLSEANPPYTDDTIGGQFSLKSRREDADAMVYRTVPASLQLKPNTTYRVSFDYLCDTAGLFALAAGYDGTEKSEVIKTEPLKDGSWKVQKFTATFTTDAHDGWFIGMTKTEKKQGTFVIDNLLVEEAP